MSTEPSPLLFHPEIFRGKVYCVTGGGHGIGRAIVRELLEHGGSVVTIELSDPYAAEVTAELKDFAARFEVVRGDASDNAVIARAIDSAARRWGRIDGWINNAYFSRRRLMSEQPEEEVTRALDVNVMAAWRSAKLLLPHFEKIGGGAIVNISSIMAAQSIPTAAAYTASKAGMEGLTRALAVELAPRRVRVNCIAPGYIRSYEGIDMNDPAAVRRYELHFASSQPWPEPGMPRHIAAAALFLLSPAAGFVTGVTLPVDGALSIDLRDLLDARRAAAVKALAVNSPAGDVS